MKPNRFLFFFSIKLKWVVTSVEGNSKGKYERNLAPGEIVIKMYLS